MLKKIFIIISGILIGFGNGYFMLTQTNFFTIVTHAENRTELNPITEQPANSQQTLGFLPYWLIPKADKDYSKYLTTLAYFGLTVETDGSIRKLDNAVEAEPGWFALNSGKVDPFLENARKNHVKLSLVIFNANESDIERLLDDPKNHADTLAQEAGPIMKQFGFTDLNLDIESVLTASEEARQRFTMFTSQLKNNLDDQHLGTLTVDASPIVLFKPYLVDPVAVSKISDYFMLMTYDFHYAGSYVTGAVSPSGGAGIDAEFDSDVSLKEALKIMPSKKILLGMPLYGYEWETVANTPHAAVIPGSGIVASNRRVEELLKTCATCSAQLDTSAKESYLIYKDEDTGTYHQFYFPDAKSLTEKKKLIDEYNIGGIAMWALGYEGNTILEPIKNK